ncbi:DUF2971 domain-containing protein [Burkholderia pyrrocinia]|uniref:DUF2971 domain-containing protein n=1 Tax=Burkholderia pyrrocinia TaxID=60550 RepID=UPI0030D2A7C6
MDLFSAAQDGIHSLYHYQSFNDRTAERLEQTLRERAIRMSKPSDFNDPWDCKPWFDLSLLDDPHEREQHLQWLAQTATIPPDEVDALRANPQQLAAYVDLIHTGHVQAIADIYRVYCLLPEADHPLMWAHYGDSHKGIALEFDARHQQIQWAYRVHYRETYPPYRLYEEDDNANLVPIFTKSEVWAYEREYRMVAEERQRPRPIMLETRDSMLQLAEGALVGVVLGCQCDELRTLDLIDQYGPDLRVRRAKRMTNKYALTLETIR